MSMIITQPAQSAVPLSAVMAHLRIDGDDQSALIGQYVAAATGAVEGYLNRPLIARTVEDAFDGWPCGGRFRMMPFLSVDQITYVDGDGVTQTLPPSAYHTVPERGWIEPAHSLGWPGIRAQAGAVRVRTVVGYGDDWNSVPEAIRSAILMMTAQLYEFREPVVSGVSVSEVPMTMRWLLDQYRYLVVA